jgi:hypothetical protein
MSYFATVGIKDVETNTNVPISSLGALKSYVPVRLIGTAFSGTTKDTNFWTETVTGSGSITQGGEVLVTTGVTADSTAKYETVRKARKVTCSPNEMRAVARLTTDPQANNLRRLGVYTANDGFFFQINGETFGVGVRKGASDTIINSGSFNGNIGASVVMDTTMQKLFIEYDHLSVKFFVNNRLLHTVLATTTSLTNSLDLPITMENNNTGGNTTDNGFEVLFASVQRNGTLSTSTASKYISTNTTTICKYGAGMLTRVIVTDNAGTIKIYDNTAGSGTVLAEIDSAKVLGELDFGISFSTGLTIVTTGGGKAVIIYE